MTYPIRISVSGFTKSGNVTTYFKDAHVVHFPHPGTSVDVDNPLDVYLELKDIVQKRDGSIEARWAYPSGTGYTKLSKENWEACGWEEEE